MSRYLTRRRIVAGLAASAFVLTIGGCTPDEEPEPDPPAGGYEQPPEDLCEQVQFEEVLQRWELSVPERHEPGSDYGTERAWWYARCNFAGQAEDGRFETEIEEFLPSGAVRVFVYHEVPDAVREYDRLALSYVERSEDPESGATTAEIAGWWDTGASLELAGELDPDDYVVGDFEITSLGVERLVRHENLVARVDVEALSPTDETTEVAALLHELTAAMLAEAVEHLPHTTG